MLYLSLPEENILCVSFPFLSLRQKLGLEELLFGKSNFTNFKANISLVIFVRLWVFSSQLSNYNSFEGVLYCRPHFDQLFKRTGSLDKSFEGNEQYELIN